MIEIVTHAYAGDLPQYAAFLRVQLTSLNCWKPKTDVKICVCHAEGDEAVIRVLDYFKHSMGGRLTAWPMPKGGLFRRSIGRNFFAKSTMADLVWFADVDHYWEKGCLDSLWELYNRNPLPPLVWPKMVLVPSNHADSDAFWKDILNDTSWAVPVAQDMDWEPKTYHKAIGGVQIVNGDFCRHYGYLDGQKKWQQPTDGTKPFPNFRDDVKFRKFCEANGGSRAIDLPGVRRLRHSATTYKK